MRESRRLRVQERSQVAVARRFAMTLCRSCNFSDTRAGEVAIVVTELATNLVKHAGGGELLLRTLEDPAGSGIEILSLDTGGGMADIGENLRDGCSTAGSPGTGLGAVRRLSAVFDIYSVAGQGTAVLSRIRNVAPPSVPTRPLTFGALCVALEGEDVCGDAWAVHQTRERALVLVADGLGHGAHACEAAEKAVENFRKNAPRAPAELLELIHDALRSTRGAAIAVAEVAPDRRTVSYAGVGNVAGRIIANATIRNLVSHNGTAGVEVRKIQEFVYPWPDNGLLVLCSDGLNTRWSLDAYPGLQQKHPTLIAGVLFRDHARSRDDCVVLVARREVASA